MLKLIGQNLDKISELIAVEKHRAQIEQIKYFSQFTAQRAVCGEGGLVDKTVYAKTKDRIVKGVQMFQRTHLWNI